MINISIKKPKPVLVMVHNASKGLRGVGLSGVTLDKNGNLIFTMSDGTVKTIKGYSQNLINTTNAVNKIKEEVSTMANNAADSAKKAKETADSIKQEYDRVEGATNSGLALIERSVLYGINRVKEATKACKSDALANIELAHKDAIDDIAIRRLEALQDIAGANAAAVSSAAAAKTSETNAETSNQMAKKWAESTESPDGATDSDSSTGNTQSSKSWALHSKSNASAAKVSETNAKTSETNAGASATTAKNWAVSETSPDGATDTSSGTGKTQSSRTWALESKASAQSASSSANTATTQASSATASAKSASTSATSASDSATSAASSATAAKNSAIAAASSASSASTSATNAKAAMNTANTAASSASTSATNASTSASNASKSEIAAKTAQAAAEKARDDANSAVAKVTGAMKYAGQVDNYSDLSDVTKNTGDVWNIVNADPEHGIKAGDNVAWNGTDWDDLSGTVDLSIYAEKADYQKAITSATANGATITFNHKDGTTSTATVNNVASATAATNDAKGQKIDTTYEKIADASNVHTSLQNSINSLSTGKQDKLTFDTTPITGSSNPVTSGGIKTALDTKLNKTDAANTYLDKLSKTEQVVTAPIKGTLNGNASSATKLATARTINVTDANGTNTGTGASFDGSGNATIKLPAKIKATLTGNADTATKATNDGNGNPIASTYLPLSGGTLTGVVNGVTPPNGDNSKKLATTEFVNATAQQADWNVTDTTSKAFVKNKPGNLVNIGNNPTFNLINFYKVDNAGFPVYFLMHELVQYNPDKPTPPISAVYGFNGMVFGQPRVGNGGSQFLALVKVGLGHAHIDLYSSSGHYSPVVIKDETNNKYYWAMRINGSYQRVYMLGTFSAPPLITAILSVDIDGNLPERWSLVHTARLYPFDNTHVASADKDGKGNTIASTYLPLSGGTLTGVVNGVTPPNGDNSKKLATTEFVNAKARNYLPLSGGTMAGDIDMHGHNLIGGQSTTGIYCAGNDNGGTLGTTGSNINIKSWYGVGFINGLRDSDTYNKVTVGIDVRTGTLQAHNLVATESIKAPNIYTKTEVDNEFSKKAETYTKTEVDNKIATGALRALAGVTPSAGKIPVFTGANTASLASITDFMKTLLGKASAGDVRSAIGAVDASGAGVVAGNVSNANAWWVKLGGTIPLIIQGGFNSVGLRTDVTIAFPVAYSKVLSIVGLPVVNAENSSGRGLENIKTYNTTSFVYYSGFDIDNKKLLWLSVGI